MAKLSVSRLVDKRIKSQLRHGIFNLDSVSNSNSECSTMAQWERCKPLTPTSSQQLVYQRLWYVLCCLVYGKAHMKDPLLLIRKSSLCVSSRFPLKTMSQRIPYVLHLIGGVVKQPILSFLCHSLKQNVLIFYMHIP